LVARHFISKTSQLHFFNKRNLLEHEAHFNSNFKNKLITILASAEEFSI